ncbi:hypothetical protein Y032_0044g916 [Ancylostoma ceylanicum]|uniref:Uncharacterized protein n=1 Tax=Ancylostoma ceylanicum TaxID=53326 RepID=A0A016UDS3_9BILA|nr:hypothetical protein Y032_0044g916 [Ancylostoma ceylanicum]
MLLRIFYFISNDAYFKYAKQRRVSSFAALFTFPLSPFALAFQGASPNGNPDHTVCRQPAFVTILNSTIIDHSDIRDNILHLEVGDCMRNMRSIEGASGDQALVGKYRPKFPCSLEYSHRELS